MMIHQLKNTQQVFIKFKNYILNVIAKVNCLIMVSFLFCSSCVESKPDWVQITEEYWYLYPYGLLDTDTYNGDAIMIDGTFSSNPIVFPKIIEYKNDTNFLVCKQEYNEAKVKELLLMCLQSRYYELTVPGVVKSVKLDGLSHYIDHYYIDSLFLNQAPQKIHNRDDFIPLCNQYMYSNSLFSKMKRQKINYYIFNWHTKKRYLALSKSEFDSLFDSLHIDRKIYIQ